MLTIEYILLQSYIRVRTDHPDPDYAAAAAFLAELAHQTGLTFRLSKINRLNFRHEVILYLSARESA